MNTTYDSASCSPTGLLKQTSRPYAPGGTQYWTTNTYDGLGRVATIVLPDGASTTNYAYSGNTSTVTDPAGKWKQQVSDVFGNLKTLIEPNPAGGANFNTAYTYDLMNHVTQISMPRGSTTQTRTFVYDAATQRLTSQTHPESGTTTYTYNVDGTLASKTDARNQMTQYVYDSYQRVKTVQRFPTPGNEDTCQGWTLKYDTTQPFTGITSTNAAGRLTEFTWRGTCTQGAFQAWAYTPAGLVSQKSQGPVLTYNYDTEGRVTSFTAPGVGSTDPAKTYTYTLDLMGRPTAMRESNTVWIQGVVYGAADEVTQRTRFWFNGSTFVNVTETHQYNHLGQLTRITIPGSLDQEYIYSATQNNGRITQAIDHIRNETISYTYDALNRLATASSSAGWGQSFTYDGFGNLTDKNVTAGSAPSLHVTVAPATNRLTGGSYTYDANGNLTGVTGQFTATYNVDNQIATITQSGGGTGTYYYDFHHRAMTSTPAGATQTTFYGAYGEHFNTMGTGGNDDRNVYFGTDPLMHVFVGSTGWTSYYSIGRDALGSLRAFGSGTTAYYPYGEEYTTTGQDREKFGTYIRDSVAGVDYAISRYYSSTLGRFLSPDRYNGSIKLTDPSSLNRYAYVKGDPVNHSDPSGRDVNDDADPGPIPDPGQTPPFGCDLFGGCVPGCPDPDIVSGGGYYSFWPGSGPVHPCPPSPIVVIPPATPPLPTCTLSVYSRPLAFPVLSLGPDLHGYLDFTSPVGSILFEGLHIGNLLQAGGNPVGFFTRILGNNPGQDTNDGSITGANVCAAVGVLEADVGNVNAAHITYGALGPNSNSVLRYMLESINFLSFPTGVPWYSIPASMQAAGFYVLLPGVETLAPSSVVPYPGSGGRRFPVPRPRPPRHLF